MNLYYSLRRSAWLHRDRVAVCGEEGNVTYRWFHARVLRAANLLRALGVEKGDRVAVLMLNSSRYLELYYATAVFGAVIVPVNTRLSLEETAFWLNDSETKLLVVDDRFASTPQQLAGKIPSVRTVVFAGGGRCPEGMVSYEQAAPDPPAAPEPEDQDLAALFYTSGTTGGSKGVMLTHRNLYANAMYTLIALNTGPELVYLHAAPMFHLADAAAVYAMVLAGAAHSFIESFEPEAFCRAIQRFRVSSVILVPTMINLLLNSAALERYDLSSLRQFVYGASPMPLELLRRAMDRFGRIFIQGYGLSEAGPLLTVLRADEHDLDSAEVKSAGRPILGVEVRVVDLHDRAMPAGEMGEIVARGDNIMKGYWRRPEISAETLGGGWLHTGDMGAFDERGFLYILDRMKDMIKTGGENVYSPEVESVLFDHPAVLEAAVIGVPDQRWGETIKAVAVVRDGMRLTETELLDFCRARLTHFKCPTSVDFIDALPKGGTGKVQKSKLREKYWQGAEGRVH